MKSANLVQIGKIVIDEHCPEPKLTSPEQTLVRVRYAAINADDYSAFAGYLGRVYNSQRLLHEFSGEIVALSPQAAAQGFAVGDHVSCNILRGCGVCPACCFSFLKSGCPRSSPSASRSPLARSLGADLVIDPATERIEELILMYSDGQGFDAVIDAAGELSAIENAVGLIDQILPLDEFQHAMQLYGSRQCLRILLKI